MNNKTETCSLVLVAPDRLFRETLAARLSAAEFVIAHVVGDVRDVRKDTLACPGTVLIVHSVQPDSSAVLDMLRDVKRTCPSLKMLVLGKATSPSVISACLEIGVNTILDEDVSFDTFLNYLRFITLDEQTLPASAVNTVLRSVRPFLASGSASRTIPVDLSEREKVVLAYLTEGASNKEIARYLGLADGTIKVTLKAVLRKINASNRTQAAIWALQHDIRGHVLKDGMELNGAASRLPSRASSVHGTLDGLSLGR